MKSDFANFVGVVSLITALGLCMSAYITTHWYEYCSRNIQTEEHMVYYRGLWGACFEHQMSQTFIVESACESLSQLSGESLSRQEKAIRIMATISLIGQVLSAFLAVVFLYCLYRLLEHQRNALKVIIILQGQSALFTFIAVGLYDRWMDLIAPQLPKQISFVIVMEGLGWSLVLAAVSGSINMLSCISFMWGLKLRTGDSKPSGSLNQSLHTTQYKSLPHMIDDEEEIP